jgi:dTDP-4-amino-4,6-dideoxygalactose transaminase
MYGLPAPMESITAWAKQRSIFVIEDAALALGTISDGKPAGAWGNISIFSFGAGKIADASGGGALLTDDSALAAEIERVLASTPLWSTDLERLNHQWLEIYWALHQFESENPQLAQLYPTLFSIYSSIVQCRLRDSWTHGLNDVLLESDANIVTRIALARLYDEALSDQPTPRPTAFIRLFERQSPTHTTLWRYPLLVSKSQRNPLLERLWSSGIYTATRWYPSLQPMRSALSPNLPSTATPAADQLSEEIINLPLDADQAPQIVQIIRDFFSE